MSEAHSCVAAAVLFFFFRVKGDVLRRLLFRLSRVPRARCIKTNQIN